MSLRITDADAPVTQPPEAAHPSCASEFLLVRCILSFFTGLQVCKSTWSCMIALTLSRTKQNNMVRTQWGQKDTLIVTDCEATASMYKANHLAASVADAAAKSINAGVDLNTGFPFYQAGGLNSSLAAGTVELATIDAALNRSLMWKMRLGVHIPRSKAALSSC